MKMHRIILPSLIALIILQFNVLCNADELSRSELRKIAMEGLKVIVDDDGCDVTSFPKELPLTRENLHAQMLDRVKGAEVDAVSYCPFSVGHQLSTASLVTDVYTKTDLSFNTQFRNAAPELLALGTDSLRMAVEFCRANKIKIFANIRVNDTHDSDWPEILSDTKREHPERLNGAIDNRPRFGGWTAFDFGQDVVRERLEAIATELLSHYDVDGLELDFFRSPVLLKSVAWGGKPTADEIEGITQMMRNIRKAADEIGRRRGRYLLVMAKIPDSAAIALTAGLDIETWMREELIDIFIAGGDYARFETYAAAVALGHQYGLPVFPSVDSSWMRNGRESHDALTAQSAAAMAAGADGLFYFNVIYSPTYLKKVHRDLAGFQGMAKSYFGYYQNVRPFSSGCLELDPLKDKRGTGLMAAPGEPATMQMELGDDFALPSVQALRPVAKLEIYLPGGSPLPLAYVNDVKLDGPSLSGDKWVYPVPVSALRLGVNHFRFEVGGTGEMPYQTILAGGELLRGANQYPWRRLFPAHDFPTAEAIVDGAYRIADTGTDAGECANLLFPMSACAKRLDGRFKVMVENSDEPDAVAFRVANGQGVEVIRLKTDGVSLKFNGNRWKHDLTDGFHEFEFSLEGRHFILHCDGEMLFDTFLKMTVKDPAGNLQGNNDTIPHMNDCSICVGSLSQEGTGSARWKDVAIRHSALNVTDVCLRIDFQGPEKAE